MQSNERDCDSKVKTLFMPDLFQDIFYKMNALEQKFDVLTAPHIWIKLRFAPLFLL